MSVNSGDTHPWPRWAIFLFAIGGLGGLGTFLLVMAQLAGAIRPSPDPSQAIGVTSPPVATQTSSVALGTPTPEPPTPSPTVALGTPTPEPPTPPPTALSVPRNSNKGVTFIAPESGYYEFRYVSGAYSTYPAGGAPDGVATWLASVCIFDGRPLWSGEVLRVEDCLLVIGWGGQYFTSKAQAAAAAQGQSLETELAKGQKLTLITVDEQSRYFDNSGDDVGIRVSYLP